MMELSHLFVNFIGMKSYCMSSVTSMFYCSVCEISRVGPCGDGVFIWMAEECWIV